MITEFENFIKNYDPWQNYRNLFEETLNIYQDKLKSKNPLVRAISVYALGCLERYESIPDIIRLLRNEEVDSVKIACLNALARYEDDRLCPDIALLLEDKSDIIRIKVIELLTHFKFIDTKDKVLSFLDTKSRQLKLAILGYISALDLTEYKENVYALLRKEKNPIIIHNVLMTLDDLKATEYEDEVEKYNQNENPLIRLSAKWFTSLHKYHTK